MEGSKKEISFSKSLISSIKRKIRFEYIFLLVTLFLSLPINTSYSYYGRYAIEAKLSFEAKVEFYSKKRVTLNLVKSNGRLKTHVQKTIKKH